MERDIACASDAELWSMRGTAGQALDYARERIAQQAASMGMPAVLCGGLNAAVLTLGAVCTFT